MTGHDLLCRLHIVLGHQDVCNCRKSVQNICCPISAETVLVGEGDSVSANKLQVKALCLTVTSEF